MGMDANIDALLRLRAQADPEKKAAYDRQQADKAYQGALSLYGPQFIEGQAEDGSTIWKPITTTQQLDEFLRIQRNAYKDYVRNDTAGKEYAYSLLNKDLTGSQIAEKLSFANPENPYFAKDAQGHLIQKDQSTWMDTVGAPIITALAGAGVGAGIGGLLSGAGAGVPISAPAGTTAGTAGGTAAGTTGGFGTGTIIPGVIPEVISVTTAPSVGGVVAGGAAGGAAGGIGGVLSKPNLPPAQQVPEIVVKAPPLPPTPVIPPIIPLPPGAIPQPGSNQPLPNANPNPEPQPTPEPTPDQMPPTQGETPWWQRLGMQLINNQLQPKPGVEFPAYGVGSQLQNPDYGPGVSGIYNPSLAALIQMRIAQNTTPRRNYGY